MLVKIKYFQMHFKRTKLILLQTLTFILQSGERKRAFSISLSRKFSAYIRTIEETPKMSFRSRQSKCKITPQAKWANVIFSLEFERVDTDG